MDIFGSIIGLVLFLPIILLTALFIKIVSPGPVLFKQQRVGFKGKHFTFLKFRTMKMNHSSRKHKTYYRELIHSDQPMEKLDDKSDPRIIFGGRVIRKACLDELPQLINVLKGELSLVGPRPCIPYEAEEYLRWHKHRFDIVPGITGLWQVSGKNKLSFQQMIRLDVTYMENLSLIRDVAILLRTGPIIIGEVLEAVAKRIKKKKALHKVAAPTPLAICQVLELLAEKY